MILEILLSLSLAAAFVTCFFAAGAGLLVLATSGAARSPRVSSCVLAGLLAFVVFGTTVHTLSHVGVSSPFVPLGVLVSFAAWGAWTLHSSGQLGRLMGSLLAFVRSEKVWLGAAGALFLLKVVSALVLADHGDPYLYHLRASETWMAQGSTGWAPENFTLGFSFVLENASFFLRALGTTPGVQGATMQIVMGSLSSAAFVVAVSIPARFFRAQGSRVIALAMLCALNGMTSSLSFLAKPDILAASLAVVVVLAAARKDAQAFLLAAPCVFVLKPNFAPFCVLAAALWFLRKQPVPAIFGGLAAAAVAAPFLVVNALRTENPFFPFLGRLFPSPYSPQDLSRVIAEVPSAPLAVDALVRGVGTLLTHRPLTAAFVAQFVLCALLLIWNHKARLDSRPLWKVASFLFALIVLSTLFTQITSRAFESAQSWRHHAFSLILLQGTCLGFALAVTEKWKRLLGPGRASRPIVFVLSALCLAPVLVDLKPDLNARTFWQFLQRREEASRAAASCCRDLGPLYADLLARKPHFQLIHALRPSLEAVRTSPVRIYSTAGNQFFGTPHVTLLAPTLSWPFYNAPRERLNARTLVDALLAQDVAAVILSSRPSKDQPFPLTAFEACWGPPQHRLQASEESYAAWTLCRPSESPCLPLETCTTP